MRVAQVATTDTSVRYLLRQQITAMQDAGHEVTAVCAPGPSVAGLQADGLRVWTVPLRRPIRPAADVRALAALTTTFRRGRFDAVITHTPKAGLLGPPAAQLAGVPLIAHTVHGLLFHDRMPLGRRLAGLAAEVLSARCADVVFFQSAEDVEVARRLRLRGDGRLIHIGNGVDTDRFHPRRRERRHEVRRALGIPADAFVVGAVGRLVWEKGYRELFAAARQVAARAADIVLVVVGGEENDQPDAIPASTLASLVRQPHLRLLGHRDDVAEIYGAFDLFVLPSHREGVPRALMEASATGIAVLASDIRGCREVVVPGRTGLLVPVRDPASLASAILHLHRHRDLLARFGAAGRNHVAATFDERLVTTRLLAVLEQLTTRRDAPVPTTAAWLRGRP